MGCLLIEAGKQSGLELPSPSSSLKSTFLGKQEPGLLLGERPVIVGVSMWDKEQFLGWAGGSRGHLPCRSLLERLHGEPKIPISQILPVPQVEGLGWDGCAWCCPSNSGNKIPLITKGLPAGEIRVFSDQSQDLSSWDVNNTKSVLVVGVFSKYQPCISCSKDFGHSWMQGLH